MKIIKLSGNKSIGKFVLVDDEDFNELNKYKWKFYNNKYASRSKYKNKTIKMHRFIINAKDGDIVDHINGNGLDNRKCNLRICTQQQNCLNSVKSKYKKSSSFKGVNYKKCHKKWQANISVNGKTMFIGYFNDEISAAKEWNIYAKKYHGKFAKLNNVGVSK